MHPPVTPSNAHQEPAPPGHPPLPPPALSTALRRRIVLLIVLPAALVAITLLVILGAGFAGPPDWGLLTGGLLGASLIITGAGFFGAAEAKAIAARFTMPGQAGARGSADPVGLGAPAAAGRYPLPPHGTRLSKPVPAAAHRLGHPGAAAQRPAETDSPGWAPMPLGGDVGEREQFEVFPNLAHRLQSLVHREIKQLDELEDEVEDPDLLKGLFRVDHLATRIRRYAENLGVLGGAVAHRQWSSPVSVADALRSAVAEIEHYSRVKLVPPVEGTIVGHAVVDVVHLIAELAENATKFSPPPSRVLLRVQRVTSGLVIEVEDRGLGMTAAERDKMNSLLTSPDRAALGAQLRDGRIGLYVVSVLARRRGITVQLENNIYGGIQAIVVLPHDLLGSEQDAAQMPSSVPSTPQDIAPAEQTVPNLPVVAPERPAVSHPVAAEPGTAEPQAVTAEPRPADDPRPVLPQRRRQENLVPELRSPIPGHGETPQDDGHTPGLMAAFQSGFRMAEQPHSENSPHGNGKPGQTRDSGGFAPKEETHDHGQ